MAEVMAAEAALPTEAGIMIEAAMAETAGATMTSLSHLAMIGPAAGAC